MRRIGELCNIEKANRDEPPEARKATRWDRAKPKVEAFRSWLDENLKPLPQKSRTVEAIRDALSRWRALGRFVDDGIITMPLNARSDRSPSEAKNSLSAGSDTGGERFAAISSLIETIKFNGLDPGVYLRNVLTRIADHRTTLRAILLRPILSP